MDSIRVRPNGPLKGKIPISGAKNAALPLMTAALLSGQTLTLSHVPRLADIASMANLLTLLGVQIKTIADKPEEGQTLRLDAGALKSIEAPYELVRKMRASILVLGPLLARFHEARVSLPGGCAIGARPVDLHLKALEALGAQISIKDGFVIAKAPKGLHGAEYTFPSVSVGATENVLMAATLAKGTTVLHNVAKEPEITDLAHCLIAMGADIEGIETDSLIIHGQKKLRVASHAVIPDRIETASYAAAVAITGGKVTLTHCEPDHLAAVIQILRQAGVTVNEGNRQLVIDASARKLKAVRLITQPYPGFPTDAQAQVLAMLTLANGTSSITETIFENRFMHVPELMRMGADISLNGSTALVTGVKQLKGAPVMATDLRASFSLVLAGLVAKGETLVNRVYHLDRGYEAIEQKLAKVGADITRIKGA